MSSRSIKDKVAVVGMGCSRFGENFDTSREDMVMEAVKEALEDAHLELKDIDAFWFASYYPWLCVSSITIVGKELG